METEQVLNKRKFFRVYLDTPLCSEITISKIDDKKIDSSSTKICVNDIGPGGLLFTSNLKFPVNDSVVFEFYIKLLDQTIRIEGIIVRQILWKNDLSQYGVNFEMNDSKREHLVRILNELAIRLKNKRFLVNSSICTKKDIVRCLKQR
ncbi:type IV pilus assembly protein PilZ [Clostridiales bacterium oral taxon 876 str. F0540]|nr:type IV pilus assembly protein PilZ [Clostridiales bacterium oral taxon 876 str. F0540]